MVGGQIQRRNTSQRRRLFFREEYIAPIPEPERQDMILAYHAQLTSADDETRRVAAAAWSKWERVSFSQVGQPLETRANCWFGYIKIANLETLG